MRTSALELRFCLPWLALVILAPETAGAQGTCRVVDVTISPPEASLKPGETLSLYPTAYDRDGTPCVAATFTWTSSDVHLVTVDRNGRITGVGGGLATITARTGTGRTARSASVAVTVRTPVAAVIVQPSELQVEAGSTTQLFAVAYDRAGNPFMSITSFAWTSSNPRIATVNNDGIATGVLPGVTIITATAAGRSGQATLEVLPHR